MSKEEFVAIADRIKAKGKALDLKDNQLLQLYSNYKQAMEGDNTTPKPSFYQLTAKAKWNAWTQLKGKSQAQAQQQYIKLAKGHLKE